jgi:hypothetical protein
MYHGVSLIIVVAGKNWTVRFSITPNFKWKLCIRVLVGHELCLGIPFTVILRVCFLSFSVEGS